MKAKSLALLATGTTLLAAGAAQADVTGLQFDAGTAVNIAGVDYVAYQLFAVVDNPTDVVFSVSGLGPTPGVNAFYWSSDLAAAGDGLGGGFYNHDLGGNLPAGANFTAAIPDLVYDTYLTIGQAAGSFATADDLIASFSPQTSVPLATTGIIDSTGAPGSGLGNIFVTPGDVVGLPVGGLVLLGQFTVLAGQHVSVGGNVDWAAFVPPTLEGGGAGQAYFEATTIPAPGALALLGLAGLVGTRRRRS